MEQRGGVLIGRRIRHGRWMLGMTRQDLAGLVGTGPEEVAAFEADASRAGTEMLWAVAAELGLPAESLLCDRQGAERQGAERESAARRAARKAPAAGDVTAAIADRIAAVRKAVGAMSGIGAPAHQPLV